MTIKDIELLIVILLVHQILNIRFLNLLNLLGLMMNG
nr:MAG TPA: hypothetical protein [Caudoviricetes sp.]